MSTATLGQMAAFRCLLHFLPEGWEQPDWPVAFGVFSPDAEAIAERAIQLAIRDNACDRAKGPVPLVAVQHRMNGKGERKSGKAESGGFHVQGQEQVQSWGAYYAPALMDWETGVFPVGDVKAGNSLAILGAEWAAGLRRLPSGDPVGWLDTLLDLLVHCAGNLAVPGVAQDLALCDVARAAMALAACLAVGEECLLVSGGISGIQDYLYDLGSEKAARILSGRSWYVEMLVLAVQERLRLDFGLLRAQTLYASGGKFLLLLPGGAVPTARLQALILELEDLLYATHRTDLALHILFAATSENEMLQVGLDRAHAKLKALEAAAKQRKFHRQMNLHFADFFAPDAAEASSDRDAIDQQPLRGNIRTIQDPGGDLSVNALTYLHFALTGELNGAEFLALFPSQSTEPFLYVQGHLIIHPCLLGVGVVLGKDWGILETLDKKGCLSLRETSLFRINGDDQNRAALFPDAPLSQPPKSYGLYLYGAKRPPLVPLPDGEHRVMDYGLLAGAEPDADGRGLDLARMGFLRMDVDNLGSALKDWGKDVMTSPARIATVSRRLDQFFKGRVEALRHADFLDSVVVHYAGGDDLFAAGRWDALIEFAIRIREEFGQWTGENPHLGLSGGISIVPVKFPVGRAAVLAGEGEDKAKAHIIGVRKSGNAGAEEKGSLSSGTELRKDSLCLLGVALRWKEELGEVRNLKDEVIRQMASSDGLRRSLIPKIHSHYLAWQESKGTNLRWRWNLVWDIARMLEMHKKNPLATDFLNRLKNDVYADAWLKMDGGFTLCTPLHALEYYRLATRWAEMALRGKPLDELLAPDDDTTLQKQSQTI